MDRPIERAWWQQPLWQYAVAGLASLMAVVMLVALRSRHETLRIDASHLTIATVQQGTYHDFIPLRARVVPRDTVYLDAVEGGRVERVMVEPGDEVTVGQPLLKFSNTELELTVLDREARLIESITQLQAYETQLEQNRLNNEKALAQIEYDITSLSRSMQRRRSLGSRGVESQETVDSVEDRLNLAQRLKPLQTRSNDQQEALRIEQEPQIKAQLDKLRRDVEITRAKLDNLLVAAPVSGRVTAIDLKVGQNRNRGERLAEITPGTGFKLTAAVDEFYLGRLHTGQSASVEINDKLWALRITRVYPQVKDGSFDVDLVFVDATPPGLLPGQAVQGKFALGKQERTLILQAGPFLEQTAGRWIFVVSERGEAKRRRIAVRRRNSEEVEIESGLTAGERVITSDYSGYQRVDRIVIEH
jgi:HlyD family secretion protein